MAEDKMVNSPDHYARTGHPQCIELMEKILVGYRGVAAFDIGQIKYIYRFGDKPEKGMTRKQKMIQDVNKFGWYVNDFESRALALTNDPKPTESTLLPTGFRSDRPYYSSNEVTYISSEFSGDKREEYAACVEAIVFNSYHLQTFRDLAVLKGSIAVLLTNIEELEPNEEVKE